ncbi:MAG: sigma-70 family RNA polymerase sigma factor [Planctomycetia bacterium]|nr:sigma-70 family RNA polymerase sigma factor [Planctomycetia bacterium]
MALNFEPTTPLDGPITDGPLIRVGHPLKRITLTFEPVAADPVPSKPEVVGPAPAERAAALIPVSLLAIPELWHAIQTATSENVEEVVYQAIDQYIVQPVRMLATRQCMLSRPSIDPDEVVSEVLYDLCSGSAPAYDSAKGPRLSQYCYLLVRRAWVRLHDRETVRRSARTVDPAEPSNLTGENKFNLSTDFDQADTQVADVEAAVFAQEFRTALDKLPLTATQRAIVQFHYFEELPLTVVAEKLNISTDALRKHRQRLLEKLRSVLGKLGSDIADL